MTGLDHLWRPAPAELTLSSTEVHVWRAALDLAASCVERLRSHLSADELERAARFHFPRWMGTRVLDGASAERGTRTSRTPSV